jgi:DNA-binding NtrC family response regulator
LEDTQAVNIFLVDDDLFCLSLYEQQLQSLGYANVHTFSNSTDCINGLVKKPDIVFLDHDLDTMNGYELLKIIKKQNPCIYVVFLSGQEDTAIIANTLQSGAFDYIIKSNQDILRIKMVLAKILHLKLGYEK